MDDAHDTMDAKNRCIEKVLGDANVTMFFWGGFESTTLWGRNANLLEREHLIAMLRARWIRWIRVTTEWTSGFKGSFTMIYFLTY